MEIVLSKRLPTGRPTFMCSGSMCSGLRISAAVVAASVAFAPAHAADDVVLRLKGGTFQIEGALKSFDGAKYVITSRRIGTLTLDATRFDCIGDGCRQPAARPPTPAAPVPKADPVTPPGISAGISAAVPAAVAAPSPGRSGSATIHVAPNTGATLVPDVIKGWAASIGGSVVRVIGAEAGEPRLRVLDRDGTEIARFDLQRRNAEQAFAALRSGAAEIAVTDRRISDEEAASLAPIAGNMRTAARETVLALDAFAVVVSPESSVVSLSIDSMARIFAGQITDWSELGQPAGRITVHANAATTGPGSLFEAKVLKPSGRTLSTAAVQMSSSEAVAEAVVEGKGGIGVAAYADMRNAKPVNIELGCGLITQASSFTVKTEEYPLSRRLYLYTARTPAAQATQKLLGFMASATAQDIVADNQLVNQGLDSLAFSEHAGRVAHAVSSGAVSQDGLVRQFLTDVSGARRLTTTVRFDSGTSVIDSKSQKDLIALAAQMRGPQLQGKTLLLLGFSDAVGTAPKNAALASRRAQQVRASLLAVAGGQIAPLQVVARGYGGLAPVSCDDTARGNQLNRRVELWVRDEPPSAPQALAQPPRGRAR